MYIFLIWPIQGIFLGSNGSIKKISVVLPNVYANFLHVIYVCTSCCYMKMFPGENKELNQSQMPCRLDKESWKAKKWWSFGNHCFAKNCPVLGGV